MRQADRLAAAKTLNMGKRVSVFFFFFPSMRLNSTSPFKTVDLPSVSELEAIAEQSASQKDRSLWCFWDFLLPCHKPLSSFSLPRY